MSSVKKRITVIIIVAIIITIIAVGLLFAYRTDIFVNRNSNSMTLHLENRIINIPLKHKYSFTTPSVKILKTKRTVDEISAMFSENLLANEKLNIKKFGEITFLYLYINELFVESIFIEPYGDKKLELRIGTSNFIPICLYENGSDFSALFQDNDKLVDGCTYELKDKKYNNSSDIVTNYLAEICQVKSINASQIFVKIDEKNIILTL